MFSRLLPIVFLFSTGAYANNTLSLDAFVAQVREKHLGVRAALTASQAAADRTQESSLLFTPQAFAEVQYLEDKKTTLIPSSMGTQTNGQSYRLGLQDQTRFGLKSRLYTQVDHGALKGTSPLVVALPDFYNGTQVLELTQPLWRNGFGAEVRAAEQALRSQARAKSFSEQFRARALVTAGERTYWRVVIARAVVGVKKASLERAAKIRNWNRKREQLELGKRSDLLQAESAVQMTELDLKTAQDEERLASTDLNSARGSDSHEVPETLEPLDSEKIEGLASPTRGGDREDVLAAGQAAEAATANTRLAAQQDRPSLEVGAVIALNARAEGLSKAYGDSFSTDRPTLGLNLKFSTPLDFGLMSQSRAAYQREAEAAQSDYQRKRYENDREWQDLTKRFVEAKERLTLSASIESTQQEKYQNERKRYDLGKTTTFQVLSFEQDFSNSQLTRIRMEAEVLYLATQMKLFGGAR